MEDPDGPLSPLEVVGVEIQGEFARRWSGIKGKEDFFPALVRDDAVFPAGRVGEIRQRALVNGGIVMGSQLRLSKRIPQRAEAWLQGRSTRGRPCQVFLSSFLWAVVGREECGGRIGRAGDDLQDSFITTENRFPVN